MTPGHCYKIRYSDKLTAEMKLAFLLKKDHGERRVYHCILCLGWHLTSQKKRVNR